MGAATTASVCAAVAFRMSVTGWGMQSMPDEKLISPETARLAALPSWIHQYDHHWPHSAIGKAEPITGLDSLAGHHSWPA